MKANELRVGNLLQDKLTKSYLLVTGLINGNIETTVIDRSVFPLPDGWEAEPIPLTPEILVKAGSVNGKLNKFYVSGNGNLTVEGYEADYNGLYIGNIKNIYVHQFQNLYFASTGDELNIEL
jgi:hypothetical protein